MQSSADGDVVIAKLEDGDDLLRSLDDLAAKHRIASGMVMWGIGMLRDFEIGYFNGKEYERATYARPRGLPALRGSAAARADPGAHVHRGGAGRAPRVVGGHLFRATVAVLNEI